MRLLYLPNEPTRGWQAGPRSALDELLARKAITELKVYSFLQEVPSVALAEIRETAVEFAPDAILFTKIGSFPVTDSWLRAIRSLPSRPLIAYYDADVYGAVFKRVTQSMRVLCRNADIVFVCGLGSNRDRFEQCGARQVMYCPHSASTSQFGQPWIPTTDRELDVVMIGNRISSRIGCLNYVPWGRMSGAYLREQAVRALGRVWGTRFGIYGNGWEGFIGNCGPVPFSQQFSALRRGWLSVGVDHFPDVPFYFSDRLPISLLSGVGHVVHFHEGYDALFENGNQLLWARDVDELVDVTRMAISMGPDYLNELGGRGRQFALETLVSTVTYGRMIKYMSGLRRPPTVTR